MNKAIEHLETLTEAARELLNPDGADRRDWEHFEMELVRSEDFLEEVKRNANLRV